MAAADKGDQAEYRGEARIQLPGRENPGRRRDQAGGRQGYQNSLDTFQHMDVSECPYSPLFWSSQVFLRPLGPLGQEEKVWTGEK